MREARGLGPGARALFMRRDRCRHCDRVILNGRARFQGCYRSGFKLDPGDEVVAGKLDCARLQTQLRTIGKRSFDYTDDSSQAYRPQAHVDRSKVLASSCPLVQSRSRPRAICRPNDVAPPLPMSIGTQQPTFLFLIRLTAAAVLNQVSCAKIVFYPTLQPSHRN